MTNTNEEVERIVEEGFRNGHIAIPEGSKWLRTSLTNFADKVRKEEKDNWVKGLRCYECGEFKNDGSSDSCLKCLEEN